MGRISKRNASSFKMAGEVFQGAGKAEGSVGKRYKAGIYARLSADGEKESIDGQIGIAEKFVEAFNRKNKEAIVIAGHYCDIGKTGSNFKRDGFNRLMQDIRLGDIDCVIVKDLSRFGRNYLEAGNYIEKIFPFLGVRFIAVADGYDTGDEEKDEKQMASEIKNLVNDMYAKDFSVKAKAGLKQQREAGSYVGGLPPYGYMAVREGRVRKLVPDENTAEIVRYIYQLFVEKESFQSVADVLNLCRLNPPAVYAKTKKVYCPSGTEYKGWDRRAVERIMKSDTYIGKLVQGKSSITARDERNRIYKEEKEWVVKKNAHAPLVSTELYRKAQDISRKINDRRTAGAHPAKEVPLKEDVFAHILYCGVCGKKMTRESQVRVYGDGEKGRREGYFCSNSGRTKNENRRHQSNRISARELTDILMRLLHTEFSIYLDRPERFIKVGKEQMQKAAHQTEREMKAVRGRIQRAEEEEADAYMDYREGKVSYKEYHEFQIKRADGKGEMERQAEELEEKQRRIEKAQGKYLKEISGLLKLEKEEQLTREFAEELIGKIYVYPVKQAKNVEGRKHMEETERGRRMEVQFRYANQMWEGMV